MYVVILSNRALVGLSLANHRQCIDDCNAALKVNSQNVKAYFRKAKSLFLLRYFKEALEVCKQCTSLENVAERSLIEIRQLQLQVEEALRDAEAKEKKKLARWKALRNEKMVSFKIARKQSVQMKAPARLLSSSFTFSSPHLLPSSDEISVQEEAIGWSVLLLYPEMRQRDVIQSASQSDMMAEILAIALPEEEESKAVWDERHDYRVSNIICYMRVDGGQLGDTLESFLTYYDELIKSEGEKEEPEDKIDFKGGVYQSAKQMMLISKEEADDLKGKHKEASVGGDNAVVTWLSFHLGASLLTLLQIKGHILIGGILQLLVFPVDSSALISFKEEAKKRGDCFGEIDPYGNTSFR